MGSKFSNPFFLTSPPNHPILKAHWNTNKKNRLLVAYKAKACVKIK